MFQTIDECIGYIENQIPQKIDLSLSRVEKAAQLLGKPQNMYKTIHITGTNGKGSTSSFTAQLLASQGLRVGLFTSPHLIKYNERIQINNKCISDEDFIQLVTRLVKEVFPYIQLTIFECITLLGFQYFADQKVDVAIIEVGLGGRYDATNIITPTVACITNISIDHVHFLSDNIEKIAYEKAGIFKVDSFNLHTVDDTHLQAIINQDVKSTYIQPYINFEADKRGFNLRIAEENFNYKGSFPMYGKHQIRNLEAALKITFQFLLLEKYTLKTELLCEQIQKLRWQGRMEQLQTNIYFDGAHNPAGIDAMIQTMQLHFTNESIDVVFSVMKDKDYSQMLESLLQCDSISHIYFLPLPIKRALTNLPETFVSSSKISEITLKDVPTVIQKQSIIIFIGTFYGYEYIKQLFR